MNLSFLIKEERKRFHDKHKINELMITKPQVKKVNISMRSKGNINCTQTLDEQVRIRKVPIITKTTI